MTHKKRIILEINCKTCGKLILTKNENRKYCSRSCSGLDRTTKVTKKCETCGKIFYTYLSHSQQRFCSRKCIIKDDEWKQKISKTVKNIYETGNVYTEEVNRKQGLANKGKPAWNSGTATILKCINCGEDFKATGNRKYTGKYCSVVCRTEYAYNTKDLEKIKYYNNVWKITRKQPLYALENFEKRGRAKLNTNNYQVDHIIPISNGYDRGLNPEIIGNIINLRMIHWKENIKRYYYE